VCGTRTGRVFAEQTAVVESSDSDAELSNQVQFLMVFANL
jgi:hypothetical protein